MFKAVGALTGRDKVVIILGALEVVLLARVVLEFFELKAPLGLVRP